MYVTVLELQVLVFGGLQANLSDLGVTIILGSNLMEALLNHCLKTQQQKDLKAIRDFPRHQLRAVTLPTMTKASLDQLESHKKSCVDPTPHIHILQGYVTLTLEV